jgi:hypothetical protein
MTRSIRAAPIATAATPRPPQAPELPAFAIQVGAVLLRACWCAHCSAWHVHGGLGHRVGHCFRAGSPSKRGGGILADAGPAEGEILERITRALGIGGGSSHSPSTQPRAA